MKFGLLSPTNPDKKDQSRWLLLIGFGAVFGLFFLTISIGLYQASRSNANLKAVTQQLNVKASLVDRMYNAARERSIELYTMSSLQDPFERDAVFLKFNKHAAEFADARLALLAMPLNKEEKILLEKQGSVTGWVYPLQEHVVDLIQNDNLAQARTLITEQCVPGQNQVLSALARLKDFQATAIAELTALENRTQKNIIITIVGLTLLTLLLASSIAISVIRRIGLMERNLQTEKQQAKITLSSIGDAVISTDVNGQIMNFNSMAEHLTGWHMENACHKNIDEVFCVYKESDHAQLLNPVKGVLLSQKTIISSNDVILLRNDNTEFAIEYTVSPIVDENKSLLGAVVVFRDVTELRSMSSKLSYQASHDSLTGLVNRREFELRLSQAIINVRNEEKSHAVCYLDLDQLKIVNDSAGHIAGDELLKQVAHRMAPILRNSDVLARLGGDEFGVLLEGCNADKALEIAEKLRSTIKETQFAWDSNHYNISVSIGIVVIDSESDNVSSILAAADTACYAAKDKGRNRIEIYHMDSTRLSERRQEMRRVQDISQAIEQDNLILYCQKIIPTNKTAKQTPFYEILLRMQNDEGEIISPMSFIPTAERYNLMSSLDKWVIGKVLSALSDYKRRGIGPDIMLSVNISGQSISNDQFVDYVTKAIEGTDFYPQSLCFELTETVAIANMTVAIGFIQRLRKLGCKFALDDFGSGLSSFTYLKNMPVDYLKIDGSFIKDICHDSIDLAFIESIQRIARMMNLQTIAEFVETSEILQKIREIGITHAQGYEIEYPYAFCEMQDRVMTSSLIQQA